MPLRLIVGLSVAALLAGVAPGHAAATHPCAADAVAQAAKLLRFHFGPDIANAQVGDGDKAVVGTPVKALKGKGKFDVLTVNSDIYKASYRMRLIYAQVGGTCVLMGQEILEASNPFPELGRTCESVSFSNKLSKALPVGTACNGKNDEGDSFEGTVQK